MATATGNMYRKFRVVGHVVLEMRGDRQTSDV